MVPAASLWQTLPVTLSLPPDIVPRTPGHRGSPGRRRHRKTFNSFARADAVLSVERPEGADRLVTRTTLAGCHGGPGPDPG